MDYIYLSESLKSANMSSTVIFNDSDLTVQSGFNSLTNEGMISFYMIAADVMIFGGPFEKEDWETHKKAGSHKSFVVDLLASHLTWPLFNRIMENYKAKGQFETRAMLKSALQDFINKTF